MPAHMTANSVMASAKRLIALRHDWFSSRRIAEISVPAWPIPIHQTKLTIANPQPIGILIPQIADALDEQPGGARPSGTCSRPNAIRKPKIHPSVIFRLRTMPADLVRNRRKAVAFVDYRADFDLRWQLNRLRHVSFPSPTSALPDWGCESPPDTWCAGACSARPAANNSGCSRFHCETRLFGSFRSPNIMACDGQAAAHAGTISPSRTLRSCFSAVIFA